MPFTLSPRKPTRPAQSQRSPAARGQRSALRDLQRSLEEEAQSQDDDIFREEVNSTPAKSRRPGRAAAALDAEFGQPEEAPAAHVAAEAPVGREYAAEEAAAPRTPAAGTRPQGSFRDFKNALRAYLTGLAPGRITATELRLRVGEEAMEAYQHSEVTLEQLQYRAVDPRGFIGYRFGEELLEVLGYYRPSTRALQERRELARARPEDAWAKMANRWDGLFTGLNGAFSMKEFCSARVQEIAIGEAFAWHLQKIIGLLPEDSGLGDIVGLLREMDPPPRSRGIGRTTSEVTISGMLAAAQVYGPQAVADYVLGHVSAKDPIAQGVHRLMDEFAGFATPYDTIPCPSDNDVGRLIKRVRTRADSIGSLTAPSSDLSWLR